MQKGKEKRGRMAELQMNKLLRGGNDGECLFMGLVRGILRDVDFLNMVLKLLKTVGFWKCGEDFNCVTSSYLSVHL